MSAIKRGLRTYLGSVAAVTALLKTTGATSPRIYHRWVPQDTPFPYVGFVLGGNQRQKTLTHTSGQANSFFRLEVWGQTEDQIDDVVEVLRTNLDGYRSEPGDTSWGASFFVHKCLLEDEADITEPPQDARDKGLAGVALDFSITYEESVPSLIQA